MGCMKILITGICGFVGSTLAKAWLEAEPGLVIYGMDNFIRPGSEQNRTALQKLGVKLIHGDIRDGLRLRGPAAGGLGDRCRRQSERAGRGGRQDQQPPADRAQPAGHGQHPGILQARISAGFILLSTSRVYSIAPLAEVAVEVRDEAFRLSERARRCRRA